MGDNSAPTLANIYLSFGFDDIIRNWDSVNFYHRFIDDIFFTFTGSLDQLEASLNQIRNLIDGIDITYTASKISVDFLDLSIFVEGGHLFVKTHQKSLNRYLYLPPTSFHPKSSFKGWIKAELIRYARTCTKQSDFLIIQRKFYYRLKVRGYSKAFLNTIFQTIRHDIRNTYNQNQNLNPNNNPNPNIILPLVITYNTNAASNFLKMKIKKWNDSLGIIFPGKNIRVLFAFKQPRNILSMCSSSNISRYQEEFIQENQDAPIGQKFLQEN
jgi:hypothetical protein